MSVDEQAPRTPVPADVNQADTIVWGLTFRQLAILAAAAAAGWTGYQTVGHLLAPPLLLGLAVPVVGAVAALVLGRRDGLPMDAWLLAAVRHSRVPHRQAPSAGPTSDLAHVDASTAALRPPAQLRLPADAISERGVLSLPGGRSASMVAVQTVNLALRTGAEQAALTGGFGRWLNSLTTDAQIVVSAQRLDLTAHVQAVHDAAPRLPHPALRAAAADYAEFLADLAATRDPLRRSVLIVCGDGDETAAARRGDDTATAMTGLGAVATRLDGPAVTAALAAAVDPYQPPVPGPRAVPDTPITLRSTP
jgi:hypothetical protein